MKKVLLILFFAGQLTAMDCTGLLACPDDDGPRECIMLQQNCGNSVGNSDVLYTFGIAASIVCAASCCIGLRELKKIIEHVETCLYPLPPVDYELKNE